MKIKYRKIQERIGKYLFAKVAIMGWILIGIVLVIVVGYIGSMITDDTESIVSPCVVIMGIAIIIGVFVPVSGYHEATITNTVKLVSLKDSTESTGGGLFYVSIGAENVYTYYIEVESEYATGSSKAYKSKTLEADGVLIVEEENCTSPRLVTYSEKPKRTFWTFALAGDDNNYVFYVPVGTVRGEISVG